MELLVNKIAKRKEFKFSRTRIIVDAEDYRARRHVGIIQKAFVLANEAIHTNKIQGLPQLTSSERMLTRIAMNYVTGVSTRTLGGGALRNIQLVPSGKEKRQKSQ
jgi:spoIIIJ-associated protein